MVKHQKHQLVTVVITTFTYSTYTCWVMMCSIYMAITTMSFVAITAIHYFNIAQP